MSDNNEMTKLEKKIFIHGVIEAKTGLHIGGSSIGLGIGGADSVVVRNPITDQPYIPGSSLKGKMRSLAEKMTGKMEIKKEEDKIYYKPYNKSDHWIGKIFGIAADSQDSTPTRLIVRDAPLLNEKELDEAENTDMPYTEVKTEVVIDRLTSAATPRQIERVPAGALFQLDMVLNIYSGDDENEMLNNVFSCLELVQNDYLGGNGTRGYGKVAFHIDTPITYKTGQVYFEQEPVHEMDITIPENLGD